MSRPRRARTAPDITEAQWAFLNDALTDDIGTALQRYELRCDTIVFQGRGGRTNQSLWEDFAPVVLERWTREHPGTRPSLWWRFDAPREPRQRVGGCGAPAFEVTAHAPRWRCGIPVDWIFADAAAEPLPAGAIVSPADPPTFEAQAAYLDRHGLLRAVERGRLAPADFAPEPIAVPA